MEVVDADNNGNVTRQELAAFIADISGSPENAHVIITDDVWDLLDEDGDGILDSDEFRQVAKRLHDEDLVAEPVIVYPPRDVEYMYDFELLQTSDDVKNTFTNIGHTKNNEESCEHIVLMRQRSAALPANSSAWLSFYERVQNQARELKCRALNATKVSVANGLAERVATYVAPVLLNKVGTNTLALTASAKAHHSSNETQNADLFHRMTRDNLHVRLQAKQRFPDIIHRFNQPPKPPPGAEKPVKPTESEEITKLFSRETFLDRVKLEVKHKRIEEKDFTDDTTVAVRGAVLFPKIWVEGSTDCGLFSATIEAIAEDGAVEEYLTDESGWFKFALARGKTFTIRAKYKTHTICYAGDTIEGATEDVHDCVGRKVDTTLTRVQDGNFVFFTDVTRGAIDLGMYQGECDGRYKGVTFKVTPINGCHASVFVTSEQIAGWGANTGLSDPSSRVWPFAAMDYSIMLDEGPSVGGISDLIADEPWKDGCATEAGNVVSFFRSRNSLERLALMRDEYEMVTIRYKYHGYICIEIVDIPKIDDHADICYDEADTKGKLNRQHFLGASEYEGLNGLKTSVDLKVKVFELHINVDPASGDKKLERCFTSLPNEKTETGSTSLSFRQDVTDEPDNECHPNRGGTPMCDFDATIDPVSQLVVWNENLDTTIEVVAGLPYLAGNHRRFVEVTVERFDTFKIVTAYAKRELIPLGSKPRTAGGLSDDTFWATVPIEGLVYTVVHDPPGGDSYAELDIGSRVGLQLDIAGSRMAYSVAKETSVDKDSPPVDIKIGPGFNAGYVALGKFDNEINLLHHATKFHTETTGPKTEMRSSNENGWSLETTTDRVIRSSEDTALPGRAGDVILGGGIELVYKTSDVLDIVKDARTLDKPCLYVFAQITWLPRKPTSYVFGVASIETQVMPNLKYLLSVVREGGVAADDSEMYYKCAGEEATKDRNVTKCTKSEMVSEWTAYLTKKIETWRRTLAWSSPPVYTVVKNGMKSKDYSQLERISKPVSDAGVMHDVYTRQRAYFDSEFLKPMDDIMLQLSETWDASFFMAPELPGVGKLGPAPSFSNPTKDLKDLYESNSDSLQTFAQIDGDGEPPAAKSWASKTSTRLKKGAKKYRKTDEGKAVEKAVTGKLTSLWDKMNEKSEADKKKEKEKSDKAIVDLMKKNQETTGKTKKGKSLFKEAAGKASGKPKKNDVFAQSATAVKQKKAKEQNLKYAKTTALKIAQAAYFYYELQQAKKSDKGTGYNYISYPRNYYKAGLPHFEENFFDDDFEVLPDADQTKDPDLQRGVYTWGMYEDATADLLSTFASCTDTDCEEGELESSENVLLQSGNTSVYGEDYYLVKGTDVTNRLVASFTGAKAKSGMRVRGNKAGVPHEDTILLTFSGGGHALEYSFSSEEKLSDTHYGISVSLSGETINSFSMTNEGLIGTAVNIGLMLAGVDTEGKSTFGKEMAYDRTFAWNQHGSISTFYSLGDPHVGDKFVVQVAADTRFGTPIFITKGGRSQCPGELQTVFREGGYTLSLATTFNKYLNPGERAVLHFSVKNASPYKEVKKMGVRLVDGISQSVHEIIAAAYDAVDEDGDMTGASISAVINKTAALTIAQDSSVVKKIQDDAGTAAARKSDASTVLAVAVQASRSAPKMGSELDDVQFSINGKSIAALGEVVPLKFIDGDLLNVQKQELETTFTLAVKPLNDETRRLDYIALRLVSLCENDLINLNRDPLSHTIKLREMSWSQRCPKVAFDGTTMADYVSSGVSPKSADPLKLVVINPERTILWPAGPKDNVVPAMNQNLKLVRVQYRPVGVGEWITAKSEDSEEKDKKKNLLCGDSRTEGCKFNWDVNNQFEKLLSGFKDGMYELRVKNFCFGGDSLADSSVHEYISDQRLTLAVDTFKPLAQTLMRADRSYTWSFSEPIDCSKQKVTVTRLSQMTCDAKGNASVDNDYTPTALTPEEMLDFSIKCYSVSYSIGGAGFWSIQVPKVSASSSLTAQQACEARCSKSGPYRITVEGVTDPAGNEVDDFVITHDESCAGKSKTTSVASLGATKKRTQTPLAALSSSVSALRTEIMAPRASHEHSSNHALGAAFALGMVLTLGVVFMNNKHRRRAKENEAPLLKSSSVANYGAAV